MDEYVYDTPVGAVPIFHAGDWLVTLDNGQQFVISGQPDRAEAVAAALQVVDDYYRGRALASLKIYPEKF